MFFQYFGSIWQSFAASLSYSHAQIGRNPASDCEERSQDDIVGQSLRWSKITKIINSGRREAGFRVSPASAWQKSAPGQKKKFPGAPKIREKIGQGIDRDGSEGRNWQQNITFGDT